MIGEDFRSRAMMNLLYSRELEQEISDLKNNVLKQEQNLVEKDLENIVRERETETQMMLAEEYLTRFDNMRTERDTIQILADQNAGLAH